MRIGGSPIRIAATLLVPLMLAMGHIWAEVPAGDPPSEDGALAPEAGAPAPEDSSSLELPAVTAKGSRKETPSVKVKTDFIRKIPSTVNDPIRAVSFVPGVTVQNDVNVRPYVRGGDAEQTRVVMDGLPLLQPYHVGGSFSLFNLSTLESVELYRDDFPVEDPGALSGVLRLKTNRRIPKEGHVKSSVSMVRGDVFAETPVLGEKLSVFGAAQSFLFNRALHGLLDLSSAVSGDSGFRNEMQGYRDHINMPDFEDYHWGAAYAPTENFRAGYFGGLSSDDYAVVVSSQNSVLSKINPNFGDPTAQFVPDPKPIPGPQKENPHPKKLSIDSISAVEIGNQMHFLNLAWDPSPRHFVENNFGFQSQEWDVGFRHAEGGAGRLSMSQSARFFNYRLSDTYTIDKNHRIKAGMSFDYKLQKYRMYVPYVLYDIIVNSNMDMLEPLGYFSDNGLSIKKEDSTRSNFDYLGEYPSRIHFSHEGTLEERFGSVFFSHAWKLPFGSLTYGVRGEYQSTSEEFFPAPRLDFRWNMNEANELLFTSGLYSQNNLPFYERDRNPSLRSEKSGQAGLQWTRRFGRGYRMMVDGYYKRYFDLVAPTLAPDRTIDLKGFLLPVPESPLSSQEIIQLKSVLDTTKDFSALPDSIRQSAYATFGGLIFEYANTGTGNSLGAELSFFYEPTAAWEGWVSADFSLSDRRDSPGGASYPYRYHRPIVFNWVNYFDIPGGFDISLTWRWAMGQPYTPYSGVMDGKGTHEPIVVGARNSGRLSPYSRLDLRLTRNARWWNRDFKAYMEVWNSMNSPNYFARDRHTGQLKSAQLNWPFPLFFMGLTADL